MERTGMIPMNLKNTDPILHQTNITLLNETTDLNGKRTHLDAKYIERKNLQGLYNHFVDVKQQESISTKIDNLVSQSVSLNDINNQMRDKNQEYHSYKHTMAGVDTGLAIVRDENGRLSDMNSMMDNTNGDLRANLQPHEGKKIPRKVR